MKKIRLLAAFALVVAGLITAGLATTTEVASAAEPFLCPVVGDGVATSDDNNGDDGVSSFQIASGTSFLPGQNQAGANADSNPLNPLGPGASPGPGDPDYTPIWPG